MEEEDAEEDAEEDGKGTGRRWEGGRSDSGCG